MNMKPAILALLASALGVVGCASRLLPEHSAIAVSALPSAAVTLLQPKLVSESGELKLVGSVYKTFRGPPTGGTHLDVAFLDGAGRVLAAKTVLFEPRELRSARKPPSGRGHYSFRLNELPQSTARIEVRAHDSEVHGP